MDFIKKIKLFHVLITAAAIATVAFSTWPIVVGLLGLLAHSGLTYYIDFRFKQPLERTLNQRLIEMENTLRTLKLKHQGIEGAAQRRNVRF